MNEQVSEQTRTIPLGRSGPVYQRAGSAVRFFLVVCAGLGVRIEGRNMMDIKGYLLPFAGALVVFAAAFLLLDTAIMNMQGLSLIFHR
jgi:hypothetical protein